MQLVGYHPYPDPHGYNPLPTHPNYMPRKLLSNSYGPHHMNRVQVQEMLRPRPPPLQQHQPLQH